MERPTLQVVLLLSVTLLFFSYGTTLSQNYNPPYPRTGQITFYNPALGGPEAWKKHDMVIIRQRYTEAARKIRELNPDVILLAANNNLGYLGDLDRFLKQDANLEDSIPEVWYAHYRSGGRVEAWGGDLMNITESCPVYDIGYGPQKFNQFLPRILKDYTDYSTFDGTFFDSWGSVTWMKNWQDIDFGDDVNASYEEGKRILVDNLRALLPDKLVLGHEGGEFYLNGNGFEFWTQKDLGSRSSNMSKALELLDKAVPPVVNYANSDAPGSGAIFRADFTSAQVVGAFFGHDEGTFAHRWTFLHDEYEANLGYPTGPPQEMESGLWFRYFDQGLIISNISGNSKTLYASQFSGGPYWRFKGAQDPSFNNGDPFDDSHPINLAGVDGIMLFKQPTTLVTPIVIDNIPKNMTTLGQSPVQYTSDWVQVTGADGSQHAYYLAHGWGDNAEPYAKTTGSGTATYQPQINVPGNYKIYEWHPDTQADGQGQGCGNVTVEIIHADGTTKKTINQQTNIGQWNYLGTYRFSQGNSGKVKLVAPGGCTTASDAIRFVYEGSSDQTVDTTPPDPPKGVRVNE